MAPIRALRERIGDTVRRLLHTERPMRVPPADGHALRLSAEARARKLLFRVLTTAQRQELERHDYFTVEVPGWGTFRILPRVMFNVMDMQTRLCYCAGPEGLVPISDLMLAQKLILENDPDRFFRVARRRREDE